MNDVYQIVKLDDNSFTFSRVQLPGLGGGSNAALSGKPNYFYSGTLEQFEADPNKAAILEQIAADGVLFTTVDLPPINPDGTFDEDALKEWLEENYLALTGGTLTGQLVLKVPNIAQGTTSDSVIVDSAAILRDKNGNFILDIQAVQDSDDIQVRLLAGIGVEDDIKYGNLNFKKRNNFVYISTSTPPDNAPDDAIQNKASVARDFLAKTGGEMTGVLTLKMSGAADSPANTDLANIIVSGTDGKQAARFVAGNQPDVHTAQLIVCNNTSSAKAALSVNWANNGTTYATCPPPRGLYNNDIATASWVMDNFTQKLTESISIHVNYNTGSDTADLNNGRGLSAAKPFKTLSATLAYAINNYVGQLVNIQLHSDVTLPYTQLIIPNIGSVHLVSDTTERTINLTGRIHLIKGDLNLEGIRINAQNINNAFSVEKSGKLHLYNCVIDGAATEAVCNVFNGGMFSVGGTVTGNVTGKRYSCTNCGRILTGGRGVNAIPGSEAGIVDATSVYA